LTRPKVICYRMFVSRTPSLLFRSILLWMGCLCIPAGPAAGIILEPQSSQVQVALQRGHAAADNRTPPDRLYAWFGSDDELEPRGFVMTKMVGLSVMSAHFALRSQTPADVDIQQILAEPTLLISAIIFGPTPTFAVESYMVLVQGDRTIKPVRVRFDALAARTTVWPKAPAYRAKVVASFAYADLNPQDKAVLSVFPTEGGELQFELDFAKID
jgi:hypothetical protein